MSLSELQAEIRHLNDSDFDELAAWVNLTRKERNPEWLARIAQINAEMDAGHEHDEEEVLRVHEELIRNGK